METSEKEKLRRVYPLVNKKMSKESRTNCFATEEIIRDGLGAAALSFHCHRFLVVAVLVSSSIKCLNL